MFKIVIIEDDLNIRNLICDTIEDIDDLEIYKTDNGEEGIEIIKKVRPDLIYLDVQLPGKDGYYVLQYLRNLREFKDMIIFVLSAKGRERDRIKGMELGANLYISKPFDPEYVLIKTCEYLGVDIE